MKFLLLRAACVIVALSLPASAATTINWSGDVGGLFQNFTLVYTPSAGFVTIDVTNNVVGPTSVAQNISGVEVQLSGGLLGTLTTVSGQLTSVAGDGSFANVSGTPDWYQPTLTSNLVTALGASGPDHTLLGNPCVPSGTYSCSNNSMTGNGPHNPMVIGVFRFVLGVPEATVDTELTRLFVAFGTGPLIAEIPVGDSDVPEPNPCLLVAAGIACMVAIRPPKKK